MIGVVYQDAGDEYLTGAVSSNEKVSADCFGAYDIRGIVPSELNERLAYRIGRCFPFLYGARKVVVGYDVRLSSPVLRDALAHGLMDSGCDVWDIGLCGTEMVYFATAHYGMDGGIMITASHNPREYNGMKFVREGSKPLPAECGLEKLASLIKQEDFNRDVGAGTGEWKKFDALEDYAEHILSYVDVSKLHPFKVVVNAGNGAAGIVLDAVERYLPCEMIWLYPEPDGNFPNGVPNPMIPENREITARRVRETGADLGVAWDGDFDRCFLFDENGELIEGYYMVGLLAQAFLRKQPKEKIIHDPRLMWNTIEVVKEGGGIPVLCKTGHACIKEKMREVNAVYGGEMSAHHYFRDFFYCDSGMIPWLLVMELLSQGRGRRLSDLVGQYRERYRISGEINIRVKDAEEVLQRIENEYGSSGEVDKTDGLSVAYERWRFNLRKSNTEPLIRLNVESYQDEKLMREKTEELLHKIRD